MEAYQADKKPDMPKENYSEVSLVTESSLE